VYIGGENPAWQCLDAACEYFTCRPIELYILQNMTDNAKRFDFNEFKYDIGHI